MADTFQIDSSYLMAAVTAVRAKANCIAMRRSVYTSDYVKTTTDAVELLDGVNSKNNSNLNDKITIFLILDF